MANIDYYANEVTSLLKQVSINRSNIGMNRVNVLPLPDGEVEVNGVNPDADIVTVESDSAQGKITVTVDGTLESSFVLVEYYLAVLSTDGTVGYDGCAKGRIEPGIYDATDLLHQYTGDIDTSSTGIQIRVFPSSGASSYDIYWCRTVPDEYSKVTVPENVEKVEVVLMLSIDGTGSVSGSCELTPMLALTEQDEPSFEPYKPDLQTQIISQQQASARITDAIGMDGSINLFPIDKGTRTSPLVYHGSFGDWYIAQNGSASYIGYASTDSGTTEATEQYRTFYNIGYQFDNDHPFLYGDLAQGTYALSFDVSRRSHFNDCEVYYEVYASDDASDIDTLIATCAEGETITFDVTAENPYISIKPTVYRPSGESWENCQLITVPFLRRAMFVNSSIDEYKKSVKKQLAELYALVSSASGGYNETQVDAVTDNVEEVE